MTKTITAQDVKALRDRTGAGMMDCKKALEENGGDLDAAIEWLRKRGIAKAEKRADRSASEGLIGAALLANGTSGVLVEVNCETDFVARNDEFGALVTSLVEAFAGGTATDAEGFLAQPHGGSTVAEYVKGVSGKTGEAIGVRRVARLATDAGQVGLYRHHNGKLATLVAVQAADATVGAHEAVAELAKQLAEHVAAAAPIAVDRTGVPTDRLESEKRIAEEQARQTGKPEEMIEKIATGKVEAFLKEVTLLPQPWVREPKTTIAQLVEQAGKAAGGALTVAGFVRFQLGVD